MEDSNTSKTYSTSKIVREKTRRHDLIWSICRFRLETCAVEEERIFHYARCNGRSSTAKIFLAYRSLQTLEGRLHKTCSCTARTHCFEITIRIGGIAASCTFITQKCTGIVFAFVRGERTLSVPVFECVVSVSYQFVSVSCRFVSVYGVA